MFLRIYISQKDREREREERISYPLLLKEFKN